MAVFASIFTILCAFALPFAASIAFTKRFHRSWKPLIFGAFTFLVFQVLLRFPLLQLVLPNIGWYSTFSITQPILYSIFLGVSAGLFEEFGRYFVMLLFLRKKPDTISAIAFGIGHGGIEAILLSGINALLTLVMNASTASTGMIFASGLERLSAMSLHIAWSVLIMKAIREKRFRWVWLAFFLHSLVDSAAAVAVYFGIPVWLIEAALVLCAVSSWTIVISEYKKERIQDEKN